MYSIETTTNAFLPEVARCHQACFPSSLSTRLGKGYVIKSLEWFLVSPKRFLYHIRDGKQVIGYCGGFIPAKMGDGSSSGMLQHAFSRAVAGLATQPWLLVHPDVRELYPFIWRNIRRKFTGRLQPAPTAGEAKPFRPFAGLVVIGVDPRHRGKGIAQQLMAEFENRVRGLHEHEMVLSVKKDNARAIRAYQNFGWHIQEEQNKTFLMRKKLK